HDTRASPLAVGPPHPQPTTDPAAGLGAGVSCSESGPTSAMGHSRRFKARSSFAGCPLYPESGHPGRCLAKSALCHKQTSCVAAKNVSADGDAIASRSGEDVRKGLVMAECSFIDYHLQSSGVVVLTLDNPPLNLTTLVTLDKLLSACRDIAADQRIRAVV